MSQTRTKYENFVGRGNLTSSTKGNFDTVVGTVPTRLLGAKMGADTYGSSAVFFDSGTSQIATMNSTDNQPGYGFWIFIDQKGSWNANSAGYGFLNMSDGFSEPNYLLMDVDTTGKNITVTYFNNTAGVTTNVMPLVFNQWVYIRIQIINNVGALTWGFRVYSKNVGDSGLTQRVSVTGIAGGTYDKYPRNINFQSVYPPYRAAYRLGIVEQFTTTASDYSDVAYSGDLIDPPLNAGITWKVNTATGSDSNDGLNAPWQTAAKATAEANAMPTVLGGNSPGAGNTIEIDTGGGALDTYNAALIVTGCGLTVRPPVSQQYIVVQNQKNISGTVVTWTQPDAGAHPLVWKTANTFQYANLWEGASNTNWMTGGVLLHKDFSTTEAAAIAALNSQAGSCWANATEVLLSTTDGSNPNTNGKAYWQSTGNGVQIYGIDMTVGSFDTRYTANSQSAVQVGTICYCLFLASTNVGYWPIGTNDKGAGQWLVSPQIAMEGSYHNAGMIMSGSNGRLMMLGGSLDRVGAYAGAGGAIPWVVYNGGTTSANNEVLCQDITMIHNATLEGSATGQTRVDLPSLFCHNASGTGQFLNFRYRRCTVDGPIQILNAAVNGTVEDSKAGRIFIDDGVAGGRIERCTVNEYIAAARTVKNSLISPVTSTAGSSYSITGNYYFEFCTLDFRGTVGMSSVDAVFNRSANASFRMRNCLVRIPTGANISIIKNVQSVDDVDFSNCVFEAPATWPVLTDSNSISYTFAQLQAMGKMGGAVRYDVGSLVGYDATNKPTAITAGASIGIDSDLTGQLFASRTTPGAYQYGPPLSANATTSLHPWLSFSR